MILKKPVYKWYVIYTKPNRETRVFADLMENKIESYLPLKKTLKYWSDRKVWSEEPLFKSYLFVKVSFIEFFNVLKIPGVIYYISFGGEPQPVPENQIENIKTLLKQAELEVTVSYKNIRKGSHAEILSGPLKGVTGEVVRLCGQYRLVIRLKLMNCCVHVNVSKDEIRPLRSAAKVKTIRQDNNFCYHNRTKTVLRKNTLVT